MVVFKKGGKLAKNEKWFYEGRKLEITNSYKYLGVYINNHLSWSLHVNYAAVQAQKVLVGTMKQLQILGEVSMNTYFKIFDTKINPILLYGAEI